MQKSDIAVISGWILVRLCMFCVMHDLCNIVHRLFHVAVDRFPQQVIP